MPHSSQVSESWHSFLGELDQPATEEPPLHCMGGFVATILYGLPRATSDLDVLLIAPRGQRAALLELGVRGGALQEEVQGLPGLRGGSQGAPEDYEDRLTEMFPRAHKRLRICALDPYDLALSKLERNIQRDRNDVKQLADSIPPDLKVLKARHEKELRWQLGNPEREDLNSETMDRNDREAEQRAAANHERFPPPISLCIPARRVIGYRHLFLCFSIRRSSPCTFIN